MIGKSDLGRENGQGRESVQDRKNGRDRETEKNRKNRAEDRDLAPHDENARAQGRDRQVIESGNLKFSMGKSITLILCAELESVSISLLQVNR